MATLENNSTSRPRSTYTNYCLIILNLLAYSWELSLGSHLPEATALLGFVPARFLGQFNPGHEGFSLAILPLFTSLFIHGNWNHLVTNVLFLFIFGGKVEEILGHGRYLLLFLAGGLGSNCIYLMFAPSSTVALIGASGAIAAVMAAYFSLFPEARFATLFILAWIMLQVLYGVSGYFHRLADQAGLAWWAHVGGFLVGLVLVRFLAPTGVPLIPLHNKRRKPPPA